MMSVSSRMSESESVTSAKASRISRRSVLATVGLGSDHDCGLEDEDEDEDCEEVDGGILKLYPSRWAPK
jgi:hypothetical protein